jgi:hypothetical protein
MEGREMTSDLDLLQQEQDYEDECNRAICDDAAALVQAGWTRDAALNKAKSIALAQQEGDNDPNGVLGLLPEAQSPDSPSEKKHQLAAISKELYELNFG